MKAVIFSSSVSSSAVEWKHTSGMGERGLQGKFCELYPLQGSLINGISEKNFDWQD